MSSPGYMEEMRLQARHDRQRRDLYRAKVYGPDPTSSARLKEMDRKCAVSARTLRRAEEERVEAIRLSEDTEL